MLEVIFSDEFLDLDNIYRFSDIEVKIQTLNQTHDTGVVSAIEMERRVAIKEINKLIKDIKQ